MERKKLEEKIIRSIKDGTFYIKCRRELHSRIPFYFVRNKNIQFLHEEDKCYRKFERLSKAILDEPFSQKNMESSKKIWICWFQGIENAPPLVKACIASVYHNLGRDYDIVILTNETIPEYVDFPEYIWEKYSNGRIPAAHYSDLIRIAVLCKYGGLWLDATVLSTSSEIPSYMKNPLFVYKSIDLIKHDRPSTICSSWLIYAHSNHPILIKTRELLFDYWKHYNHLEHYFLFHIFLALAARKYSKYWDEVPLHNNHSPHVLQQELSSTFDLDRWNEIKKISCFHKLNHHLEFSENNTFYTHIIKEYVASNGEELLKND